MSQEEIEHQQYIEALENSYSLSKEIIAQRERDRRANRGREQREETSMRVMDPTMARARAEARDGARARDRSASWSSCGTGLGDASGQDSDGDYLSAVEIAPYHGKSILTSSAENKR